MTETVTGSRKRVRSNNCEEECCDFMPLSKRINNLHINNGSCCGGLHTHNKHIVLKQGGELTLLMEQQWNEMGLGLIEQRPVDLEQSIPSMAWMSEQVLAQYAPDLSSAENPFYYENNKLLFALYMERMQRAGQSLY